MSKMSTKLVRHVLTGPTMGTRWQAVFHVPEGYGTLPVQSALQSAVGAVDKQMSTWKPDSDLMRINRAATGQWIDIPQALVTVLHTAFDIGRASGGAFDIGVGDAVSAWGFGPAPAEKTAIRAALDTKRRPAHDLLELDADNLRARKLAEVTFDLSGIAKGYGVDCLAEVLLGYGIPAGLVMIDGEVRAMGAKPNGDPWAIVIERPDHLARTAHSILTLEDAAVATSGDYRHWVTVAGQRLSHTIDPANGGPLKTSPASVSVIAPTCMVADAWATALMVKGSVAGAAVARAHNLDALFLDRDGSHLRETRVGNVFGSSEKARPSVPMTVGTL